MLAGRVRIELTQAGFGDQLPPSGLPIERLVDPKGVEPLLPDCQPGALPLSYEPTCFVKADENVKSKTSLAGAGGI